MNTFEPLKRRQFLTAATGAAGFALANQLVRSSVAIATDSPSSNPDSASASAKVLAELEAKGDDVLNVPRKDGEFLNLLIKVARAKNVLELGTSHGYSAIWIGFGLEETQGKLTTLEIRAERVKLATENVNRAGLSHRIALRGGDAHELLPKLEGPFDFAFLDADKSGCVDYFSKLFPKKLTPGGLIVVHNAIQKRDAMKDYLDLIGKHPEFDSVILSLTMNDGFAVSYRHRA